MTKIWKKYSQFLFSGEWHIHTNYTDGKNSIDEYCGTAVKLHIPLVAFTEHVRRNLDYNFNSFIEDIEKAREQYDLIILSGCETKVLPEGILDVEDSIIKQVDYPIFAFHSFTADLDNYIAALHTVLRNPQVNTWAHPSTFFNKSGLSLSEEEVSRIFKMMKEKEILIELNRKYDMPSSVWINQAKDFQVNFVRGSDCHHINEMR